MYLDPGSPGPNEFHVILPAPPSVTPRVTAMHEGGAPQRLRQFSLSTGHYVDLVTLTPGTWHFSVTTGFHHRSVTFAVSRTVQ